jgi:membrane protein YdbS with pleckstrin-like domain
LDLLVVLKLLVLVLVLLVEVATKYWSFYCCHCCWLAPAGAVTAAATSVYVVLQHTGWQWTSIWEAGWDHSNAVTMHGS